MPGVIDGYDQRGDRVFRNSSISLEYPSEMREMLPYRSDHHSSIHSNGYNSDQHSDIVNEDGPTFLLEHLATFTVNPQTELIYPADGMRRLLQMEKTSGIWTQKMQIRLERKWVIIIDHENGDVVERFPMSLIREPTAFTSQDPKEMYNNIFIFIVSEDPERKYPNPSEMHIFQCVRISATEVVEEMKLHMAGKVGKGPERYRLDSHIPPPPTDPPPEPPINGVNVREQVSVFNAAAAASHSGDLDSRTQQRLERVNPTDIRSSISRDGASINDETSSTFSDKYERDVTILNKCFDDIEKFIARLQHAAAAGRELERRRRNRKSKKKDLGDGMLSVRAKLPPEREFVDIFQKFKLSFNLLAKLKGHIHDPNAPELVHFLFTPLALIVDASRDSNYGTNLPEKVLSPLMTRDAILLLLNCLTSKESELWHSLGDPWRVSMGTWRGYIAPYQPVFMDGWAPEYPIFEERERAEALGSAVASEAKRKREEEIRAAQHEVRQEAENREHQFQRHIENEREKLNSRFSSDYDYDSDRREPSPPVGAEIRSHSYENRNYESWTEMRKDRYSGDREKTHTPPSEQDFRGHGPHHELPPAARPDVSARSDISADSIERVGGGPHDHQLRFERQQRHWLEDLKAQGTKVVQVTYPRTANNDKELTVIRGEYLEVIDDSRKWWKARNIHGQIAHVPHTIVTPYQPGEQDDIFSNPLYTPRAPGPEARYYPNQESPRERESNPPGSDTGRPPRMSPPIPPPAPAEWVQKERRGKKEEDYNKDLDLSEDEDGLPVTRSFRRTSKKKSKSEINGNTSPDVIIPRAPTPPPMPSTPPGVYNTNTVKSTKSTTSQSHGSKDLMQEELKYVLTMFRMKKPSLDIHKTPDAFIGQNSSAADVQEWLKVKDFSEKVCKQLKGLNGEELFALNRKQLEQYFGKEEGSRLDSQITIQRNVCGFKTARSSELRAILAKAKEKAEGKGDMSLDSMPPLSPSDSMEYDASDFVKSSSPKSPADKNGEQKRRSFI